MKLEAIPAAIAAALVVSIAYHAPGIAQGDPGQKAKTEAIYGYRMMNDAERNEYREKMRNANTEKERQALRDEHRSTMEARMKERGMEPGRMHGKGGGPGGPGAGKGGGPGGPGMGAGGPGPGYGKGAGPGGPGKGPAPGPQGGAAPPK